jgi:hypothetical protein
MRFYLGKINKEEQDPDELKHSVDDSEFAEQEALNKYENQREDV